jgi:hypothetical protein
VLTQGLNVNEKPLALSEHNKTILLLFDSSFLYGLKVDFLLICFSWIRVKFKTIILFHQAHLKVFRAIFVKKNKYRLFVLSKT